MNTLDDNLRFEAACDWLLRLREESALSTSSELVMEWLAWCREHPANGRAFERAREIWMLADGIEPVATVPTTAATTVPADRASAGVSRERRSKVSRCLALAAAAAVAAIALLVAPEWLRLYLMPASAEIYATKAGQSRVVRLPDGSTVALAGGSRLLTTLDGRSRALLLDRGQAYFEVARDPSRPFVVTAGDMQVTAVGTAFDVRTSSSGMVVSVAEGIVDIDDHMDADPHSAATVQFPERITLRARAGQKVALNRSEPPQVTAIDPATAASWQDGRLIFIREPLSAVVDSIARHTGRRLVIADPAAGELRYTGTVFATQLNDWLRGLPMVFHVRVEDRAGEVVIASAR
jgi:transmembrane sensor